MQPDAAESYPQSPADSHALLLRARRGERDAFDRFVDRFKHRLLGYLLQSVGDAHRAEDLLQEVFLKTFASDGPRGSEEPVMTTWLFTIARRCVLDYLRACRRRPLRLADTPQDRPAPPEQEPLAVLLHRESLLRAANMVHELPDEQREIVSLRFHGGLTHVEIARVLGEPEGTVKSRLRAALLKMKRTLAEDGRECGS